MVCKQPDGDFARVSEGRSMRERGGFIAALVWLRGKRLNRIVEISRGDRSRDGVVFVPIS
jgi:hypothetical protein